MPPRPDQACYAWMLYTTVGSHKALVAKQSLLSPGRNMACSVAVWYSSVSERYGLPRRHQNMSFQLSQLPAYRTTFNLKMRVGNRNLSDITHIYAEHICRRLPHVWMKTRLE